LERQLPGRQPLASVTFVCTQSEVGARDKEFGKKGSFTLRRLLANVHQEFYMFAERTT